MSLGLTLCQAKVYLALCNFGVLDAKSIAKYADVPRPDVYRVVNELEKSGLIDRNLSRPTTFQALELDRGIDILLKKRREETEKITALTRIILTKKQEKKIKLPCDEHDYVFLAGRAQIDERAREFTNGAQRFLDVVGPWQRFKHILTFSESIKNAWARGVKTRFIIDFPSEEALSEVFFDFYKKSSLCEVRFLPFPPITSMGLYDRKNAIVVTKPELGPYKSSALLICNPSLVGIVQDYFDILWMTTLEKPEYNID